MFLAIVKNILQLNVDKIIDKCGSLVTQPGASTPLHQYELCEARCIGKRSSNAVFPIVCIDSGTRKVVEEFLRYRTTALQ